VDVRLALTGFGNVGQGMAILLRDHGSEYEERYGVRLVLTGVADRGGAAIDRSGIDPASLLGAKAERGTVAHHPSGQPGLAGTAFLDASGAQVLVEAASTNFVDAEPGWSYAMACLERDMDLVLASKGALVLHFRRLFDEAKRRGKRVLFAGTVGAPLPVIELTERVLVGARIDAVEGILNATTNQILTSMEEGASYEDGLRRAQEIGIAETDPTLDVDGWDAAAKAVIIANFVFGADLKLEDVKREGIRGLTSDELMSARREGNSIRLIARVERGANGVTASVGPMKRSARDTLGGLRNDEAGVLFHTHPFGIVSSTVQSTGGIPTALTVLRDVFNLALERGWRSR
jgi:homoserine dehydrogenase